MICMRTLSPLNQNLVGIELMIFLCLCAVEETSLGSHPHLFVSNDYQGETPYTPQTLPTSASLSPLTTVAILSPPTYPSTPPRAR